VSAFTEVRLRLVCVSRARHNPAIATVEVDAPLAIVGEAPAEEANSDGTFVAESGEVVEPLYKGR
jgi:hypothetical protein